MNEKNIVKTWDRSQDLCDSNLSKTSYFSKACQLRFKMSKIEIGLQKDIKGLQKDIKGLQKVIKGLQKVASSIPSSCDTFFGTSLRSPIFSNYSENPQTHVQRTFFWFPELTLNPLIHFKLYFQPLRRSCRSCRW